MVQVDIDVSVEDRSHYLDNSTTDIVEPVNMSSLPDCMNHQCYHPLPLDNFNLLASDALVTATASSSSAAISNRSKKISLLTSGVIDCDENLHVLSKCFSLLFKNRALKNFVTLAHRHADSPCYSCTVHPYFLSLYYHLFQ